jgi:hypothetical protein
MSLSYVWEKFFSAVLTLSQGDGNLQSRLEYAFESVGRLKLVKSPDRMPTPEIEEKFDRIWKAATARDTYEASAKALGELEARAIAEDFVSAYTAICEHKAVVDYLKDLETERRLSKKG